MMSHSLSQEALARLRGRHALARFAAAIAALGTAGAASAFQFTQGPVDGNLDSTVSVGALWRVDQRDPSNVGIANGGTARTVNGDDGNLSFQPGDLVSSPLKLSSELELRYQNFGLFTRGYAFVDPKVILDNDTYGEAGYSRLHGGGRVLDAFLSGRFHVAGRNTNARIGWQVVSWGESTFITNGINVINPIDLTRIRSPGSEIKEALLPSPMMWVSQELTHNLSVEGFALTQFNPVRLDPRFSFFSTTDVLSDDGNCVFLGGGRRNDDHFPITNPVAQLAPLLGPFRSTAQLWVPRSEDQRPSDSLGQFGVALRYLAPWANNTEFGLYYLNYASRIPFVSTLKTDAAGPVSADGAGGITSLVTSAPAPFPAATGMDGSARYYAEYPDNIHLIGASFSTTGPWDTAVQGEYSYRPNQPIQVAATEVFFAALNLPSQFAPNPASVPFSSAIPGYRRTHFHQAQVTVSKSLPRLLASDQVIATAEVGYVYQDLPDGIRYDGPGVALPSLPLYQSPLHPESGGSIQTDGFATHSSWGYRVFIKADYSDVFAGVNVVPRLAFSHDVHGVSSTFNQNTKSATAGLGFNYISRYSADLAYTAYFDGRTFCGRDNPAFYVSPPYNPLPAGQSLNYCTSANAMRDRDFVALTLSYSF